MSEPIKQLISDYTQAISWSHPTWDLFILVFLLIGTLLYGFSLGRDRIIMIMIALYMALVAVMRMPFIPTGVSLAFGQAFAVKVGAFVGLFVILFFLLTRSALNHAIQTDGMLGKWWHIILLSFLQVGMLISVIMSFLPEQWTAKLATLTQIIFVSAWGKFTWVVLPILGLLVVGLSMDRKRGSMYE